jgi:hypothetical protein
MDIPVQTAAIVRMIPLLYPLADKLLFMLTSLKQPPIQAVQGQLFGRSQAHANKWIHLLHPVWKRAVAPQEVLPARPAAESAPLLATPRPTAGPTPPLFGPDGTARPSHRPVAPEAPQDYDSGKKKCPTVNNLLVIHEACDVCFLRATYEGKAPEKSLAALEGDTWPRGSGLSQARGLPGFMRNGLPIVPPKRTPRGSELTPPEEATPRWIASIRMRIAHAMGGVTRARRVTDKRRLLKEGMRATIMKTCCGLHHFR